MFVSEVTLMILGPCLCLILLLLIPLHLHFQLLFPLCDQLLLLALLQRLFAHLLVLWLLQALLIRNTTLNLPWWQPFTLHNVPWTSPLLWNCLSKWTVILMLTLIGFPVSFPRSKLFFIAVATPDHLDSRAALAKRFWNEILIKVYRLQS